LPAAFQAQRRRIGHVRRRSGTTAGALGSSVPAISAAGAATVIHSAARGSPTSAVAACAASEIVAALVRLSGSRMLTRIA
jgi:hypothetical protein